MKQYKYCVKLNRQIVAEGLGDLKIAKQAFRFGRNSYGSITEIDDEGNTTEIGHKKIGGKLYCWL